MTVVFSLAQVHKYCSVLIKVLDGQGPTGSRYPTRPELFFKYPTQKLKMSGYRVIKFHFETNETQPRMKRTANKVKDPINPSTGNHFLSFIEESEQEQMQ